MEPARGPDPFRVRLAAMAESCNADRERQRWLDRKRVDPGQLEAARARRRLLEEARRAADAERAEAARWRRERLREAARPVPGR